MRKVPKRVNGEAIPDGSVRGGPETVRVAIRKGIKARSRWESTAQQILDSSEEWIVAKCAEAQQPALSVNLGFQHETEFLKGHRLQDYSVFIADRIKELCGVQFSSLRIAKKQSKTTTVSVGEMRPEERLAGADAISLLTRRSYATQAYADEVRDHTARLHGILVPNVKLRIHVSYVTGLPRTWSRLWQPTIAAIFANGSPKEEVDSSQAVDMRFDHLSVGDELGHSVRLTISAEETPRFGNK